jgi:hypothetical protein
MKKNRLTKEEIFKRVKEATNENQPKSPTKGTKRNS